MPRAFVLSQQMAAESAHMVHVSVLSQTTIYRPVYLLIYNTPPQLQADPPTIEGLSSVALTQLVTSLCIEADQPTKTHPKVRNLKLMALSHSHSSNLGRTRSMAEISEMPNANCNGSATVLPCQPSCPSCAWWRGYPPTQAH